MLRDRFRTTTPTQGRQTACPDNIETRSSTCRETDGETTPPDRETARRLSEETRSRDDTDREEADHIPRPGITARRPRPRQPPRPPRRRARKRYPSTSLGAGASYVALRGSLPNDNRVGGGRDHQGDIHHQETTTIPRGHPPHASKRWCRWSIPQEQRIRGTPPPPGAAFGRASPRPGRR